MSSTRDFPGALKIMTVWCLLGLTVFLAISAWQRSQNQVSVSTFSDGQKTISVKRSRDAHYYLVAQLNGEPIEFLIDTGATTTSIPWVTAQRLNLPLHSKARFSTANGEVEADIVLAQLRIGDTIEFNNLRVAALSAMTNQALLGMDVLSKFSLTQESGVLRMTTIKR